MFAQPIVRLSDHDSTIHIAPYCEVLEDSTFSLTLEHTRKAKGWIRQHDESLYLGLSHKAYWIRFTLRYDGVRSPERVLFVAGASVDSAKLFTILPVKNVVTGVVTDSVIVSRTIGGRVSYRNREVWSKTISFKPVLPREGVAQYIVYIAPEGTAPLHLQIMSERAFFERETSLKVIAALIIGALLFAFFYNLFLWLSLGRVEKLYLYYLLLICSYMSVTAHFRFFIVEPLFPEHTQITSIVTLINTLLPGLFSPLFGREFLQIRKISRTLDIMIVLSGPVLSVGIMLWLLFVNAHDWNSIVPVHGLFGAVFTFWLAGILWKKRSLHTRLYLAALVSFLLYCVAIVLLPPIIGIKPFWSEVLTEIGVSAGATVEIAMFSFALASRIRDLQRDYVREQQQRLLAEEREEQERIRNEELASANEEIRHQQALLAEANVELVRVNEEKNEIMGIVAHDLKNPIGAVRGLAEMIEQGYVNADEAPKISTQIIHTTDRMLDLVKKVLDVNQLEQGGMQLTSIPFDITTVVESVVGQYQSAMEAKRLTIHFQKAGTEKFSTRVVADEQATFQILDNLISNAVKYSPHGKNVFVRVRAIGRGEGQEESHWEKSHSSLGIGHLVDEATNAPMTKHQAPSNQAPSNQATKYKVTNIVRVEVADEGPGLSADDMQKLFGKFARLSAQPTGGEHSTGLGLSIVKKLVEAMGGRVWCESELGKGATFVVELPRDAQSYNVP
jgi:signal transduction histidine kinase